jgi:enoyl-CoA hydratase
MTDVLVDRVGEGIAVVTLNRPEALNAMTPAMAREFDAALSSIADDPSVRVVVLTGAGRGFCAGAELGSIAELDTLSVQERLRRGLEFVSLSSRVRAMPQPVIAAVNGPAYGLGFGLALTCDIRVAGESARFGVAYIRLGLSGCEMGLSYLLPRIVGPTAAFEMMLTGRTVDAAEAERLGLVLRLVPDDELLATALEIGRRICDNSPFGVRMTKEVMWTNLDAASLHAAMELEMRTQALCTQTLDQREAIAAFMEKRPPAFVDS